MNRLTRNKRCEFCCRMQEDSLKTFESDEHDTMLVCEHCHQFLSAPVVELCLADLHMEN